MEETTDESSVVHLHAIAFASSSWLSGPVESDSDIQTNQSTRPSTLPNFTSLALPHYKNSWFTGPINGCRQDLLSSVANPENCSQSNTDLMDPATVLTPLKIVH
jgi:hypothetical protein